MEAYLVLADAAQNDQASGKLSILGGGWSITGPTIPPMSVVIFLRATVEEAAEPVEFILRLVDIDREPVKVEAASGSLQPLEYAGRIHLLDESRPRDSWTHTVGIHSSFAVNIARLPLPAGHAYTWILQASGEDVASVMFAVRADPESDED